MQIFATREKTSTLQAQLCLTRCVFGHTEGLHMQNTHLEYGCVHSRKCSTTHTHNVHNVHNATNRQQTDPKIVNYEKACTIILYKLTNNRILFEYRLPAREKKKLACVPIVLYLHIKSLYVFGNKLFWTRSNVPACSYRTAHKFTWQFYFLHPKQSIGSGGGSINRR